MRIFGLSYSTILLLAAAAGCVIGPAVCWPEEGSRPPAEAGTKNETSPDTREGEAGEPYHVEADVTEGYYTAGEQVLHGIGHVVIVHAGTTITCDEAYSYEAEKVATLLGNVKVKNDVKKYTLTSGYAEYRRDEKLSVATKNPRLVIERERPVTVTADIMRMWTDRNYGEAAGDVKVVSEDVEGFGQKLKYFGDEDRIELSGKPVVHQGDSRLAGDVITLFLEEEKLRRALAEGSARILYFSRNEEEEEEETAPEAEGQPEGGAAGSAIILEESAEETGPAVAAAEVLTPGGEEEEIRVEPPTEKAPAEEGEEKKEAPSGRVEASGNEMEGFFTDGVLEQVDIAGAAEGHYWPFDEFGRETGEQVDAAGDLIRITMNGGEVKKIAVEGNAEGVYRPAKAEGRSGVTQTAGDRITVFVTAREVRRIVVFGRARGSYFTEETPAVQEGGSAGG